MRIRFLVPSLVVCSFPAFAQGESSPMGVPSQMTHTIYIGPTEIAGGVVRAAYELGLDLETSVAIDISKSAFNWTGSGTKQDLANFTFQYTNYFAATQESFFWGLGVGYRKMKLDLEFKEKDDDDVETTYTRFQDQKGPHAAAFVGKRWIFWDAMTVRLSAGAGYWHAEGKVENSPGMPKVVRNVYKVTDVLFKMNFTSQLFIGYQF